MQGLAERVSAWWALAGGLIVIAIMAVTSVNVSAFALDRIARLADANVAGLPGYEDFISMAIACAACMFLPYCQARRGHVVVDLLASKMPGGIRRALDRLWLVVTLLLALFLAWWMVLGMIETRADNALSQTLGWPIWPTYLPGILSLILWALVALSQLSDPGRADA